MKLIINIENTDYQKGIKFLEQQIKSVLSDDITHLITNANIGSVLQDTMVYETNPLKGGIVSGDEKYSIGIYEKKKLYIDPYLRWDDKKIILMGVDDNNVGEIIINDKNNILL